MPSPSSTASQSQEPGPVTSAARRFNAPASRVWLPNLSLRVTLHTPGSPAGQCSISFPASTLHSAGSIGPATHVTGSARTVGDDLASITATSMAPAFSTQYESSYVPSPTSVTVPGVGSSPGTRVSMSRGAPPR